MYPRDGAQCLGGGMYGGGRGELEECAVFVCLYLVAVALSCRVVVIVRVVVVRHASLALCPSVPRVPYA